MTAPITPEAARELAAKATPGPWLLTSDDSGEWGVDTPEWGIATVAACAGLEDPNGRTDANARLIAAAPTLATLYADQADELARVREENARMREAPFPDDTGFYGLIGDAMREAEKAMRKFPQPNYVISKIAEEAGEVVKAAIHCAEGRETAENLRGEMKQTIAMLYRLWIEGDQVHGLPSVRAALSGETP